MKLRKYLGPSRLFVWHSIHGILTIVLVVTGFGMYFSDLGTGILSFEVRHELHRLAGIAMTVAFVLFFVVYHLEANRHQLHYYWRNFLHRIQIAKEATPKQPHHRKPVSMSRYRIIMFLFMPLIIITGVALLFPDEAQKTICEIPLYFIILTTHLICTFIVTVFTIVHVYIAWINKKQSGWLHRFLKFWFKL